jgi:uncharacterized protein YebE (UPF0316 family)
MLASIELHVFLLTTSLFSALKQELAIGESLTGLKVLLLVLDLSLIVQELLHILHLSSLACLLCFRIELGLVSILQGN